MLVLQHLALAKSGYRGAQMRHEVVLRAGHADRERARQNVVAQNDGVVGLPHGIDRRTSATRIRRVEHIVVDKRRGMYHLDEHRREIRALGTAAAVAVYLLMRRIDRGREHRQYRSYTLAARRKHVHEHLLQQFALGIEIAADELVESCQIGQNGFADRVDSDHRNNCVNLAKITIFRYLPLRNRVFS